MVIQDTYIPIHQPTPTLDNLINGFSSSDVNERAEAAYQAGFYYDHPNKVILIPYLVAALQESDCGWDCSRVRAAAAQSIGLLRVYDKQAVEILISWLTESGHSEDELLQAIQTIDVFSQYASEVTPSLINVLMAHQTFSPNDYQIRVAAASTLSEIGNPVAIPYLTLIVSSPNDPDWVRKSVAISLAKYGPSAACTVPYLTPMLDSPVSELRISSAIIINQVTENSFPDSEPENWDPNLLGSWKFKTEADGEYSIVIAAKNWWQKVGSLQDWPKCSKGLEGENILP